MEFIDNNDIENFTKDGAILCKGIFSDWVNKLRIGVDKLIANPSIRERSYIPEDGTAPFFQDLVNWNRIPEFNDFIFKSGLISKILIIWLFFNFSPSFAPIFALVFTEQLDHWYLRSNSPPTAKYP